MCLFLILQTKSKKSNKYCKNVSKLINFAIKMMIYTYIISKYAKFEMKKRKNRVYFSKNAYYNNSKGAKTMEYESLLKLHYKNYNEYLMAYDSRFNNECATQLSFKIHDNIAFYLTNQEVLLLITNIMSMDKELTNKISGLPELALQNFTVQLLIDEIKQTNDIESVFSTKKEISETYKKIKSGENSGRFKGLISKYLKFQTNEEIKLESCEDIRKLYDELVLEEVVEDDKDNAPDGLFFRKDPVSIHSSTGKVIHNGLYPESIIINAMTNALAVLNDKSINYLISAALFHYMFAYIHPFYDGNGRMDRFISSYAISKNLNNLVAYKLSYTIKKHQKQYYEMFSDANDPRNKGDLTPFIIQFLEFVLEAEIELDQDVDRKISEIKYYLAKIEILNLNKTEEEFALFLLYLALFNAEGVTANNLSIGSKKSYNTVRKAISHFEELGILRTEKSGNKKLYDLDLNELSLIN